MLMKIRANQFLKVFITSLIVLGYLAPALPFNSDKEANTYQTKTQLTAFHQQGLLLALIQPLTENEEREDDKSCTSSIELPDYVSSKQSTLVVDLELNEIFKSSLCFKVGPSLFVLHHSYLI